MDDSARLPQSPSPPVIPIAWSIQQYRDDVAAIANDLKDIIARGNVETAQATTDVARLFAVGIVQDANDIAKRVADMSNAVEAILLHVDSSDSLAAS